MKNLTLASVLALVLAAGSAYAASDMKAEPVLDSNVSANGKVMTQSDRTDPAAREGDAIDNTQDGLTKADSAMRDTADDIKAFFSGDGTKEAVKPVTIRRSTTADAMIGQDIVNAKGEKIAKVKDILVDSKGNPTTVIVSDGGMLGIGDKLAAFDYGRVRSQDKDGNVHMNLTEGMIKDATKFSYDEKDAATAKVLPKNSSSVDEILDGSILDAKGDKVADIENVAFDGANTKLIVKFNDTFGLGGDLAALNLKSLERVDNDGEVNYRMSANQSDKFKNYKKAVE